MASEDLQQKCFEALNKLCKWRMVFTDWQLGTRARGDSESEAVRDHREVTIILRAEVSTIIKLLTSKGVCTEDEFRQALLEEAQQLDKDYETAFPGMQSTPDGMQYDRRATETMRGWKP